jgi:hypothetical protein
MGKKKHVFHSLPPPVGASAASLPVGATTNASAIATASVATLQDSNITPHPMVASVATLRVGDITPPVVVSVATLQDSGITPPVVAGVATLQDKPIGSFLASLVTPPVSSVTAASPPVGAATISGVSVTTPPVGAIASANRCVKPIVEEDLSRDIDFANATQHGMKSVNTERRVVTSSSTSASTQQIVTLPNGADGFLSNLCQFCHANEVLISWMCSLDENRVLHTSGKFMKYHKLTSTKHLLNYTKLTRSEIFDRVWLFYFHDIGLTVYINADNTTRVRIGYRNVWVQEYTTGDAIEMLCKCLTDYNMKGIVPFSVHPRLVEPTRIPQQPVAPQPFTQKHDDFPVLGLGLKMENTVVPPVALQVASASVMSRTFPQVASASVMSRTSSQVASASGMSRTSPEVASASGMSRTSHEFAPSVARIFAPTVVAPTVAPVAVAPVTVASVAVEPEDPKLLAFKRQQAIDMEKFILTQNYEKMVLEYQSKLTALSVAEKSPLSLSQVQQQSK